jgi:hypothetical protein
LASFTLAIFFAALARIYPPGHVQPLRITHFVTLNGDATTALASLRPPPPPPTIQALAPCPSAHSGNPTRPAPASRVCLAWLLAGVVGDAPASQSCASPPQPAPLGRGVVLSWFAPLRYAVLPSTTTTDNIRRIRPC